MLKSSEIGGSDWITCRNDATPFVDTDQDSDYARMNRESQSKRGQMCALQIVKIRPPECSSGDMLFSQTIAH